MRNLLYLFVFTALLLGLSACSSCYYSMLGSGDLVGEKNEGGDFMQKSDTVRISCRFWGEDAPITITIYSKLGEPLYVDWGRSALIINDVATTYGPKVTSVGGGSSNVASSSSFHWSGRNSSGWNYSEGSFSGNMNLPKGVEFIPPCSRLVNTPLQLTNFPFSKISKEGYVKEQMTTKVNTTVNIRVKDFAEENSPLRFCSYLTLFARGTNGKPLKHSSFERDFYLTKLIKVGDVAPQYFDKGQ